MENLAKLASEPENATVVGAIRQASAKSGVDFSYLLQKAATESSLNPTAQASTSSASGLYQFIDQTWLQEMAQHGGEYGLSTQAAAISVDGSGHASISDPAMRRQIMALKNDPTVAAEMAASFTKDNQAALQSAGIGKVGPTELYLAHFLGAGGAAKFLTAMKSNASQPASAILPQAADANEPVFFKADGSARSLSEIYNRFAAKFTGSAPVTTASVTASASAAAAYAGVAQLGLGGLGGESAGFASPYSARATDGTANGSDDWSMGKESIYEMILFSQLSATDPAQRKAAQAAETAL